MPGHERRGDDRRDGPREEFAYERCDRRLRLVSTSPYEASDRDECGVSGYGELPPEVTDDRRVKRDGGDRSERKAPPRVDGPLPAARQCYDGEEDDAPDRRRRCPDSGHIQHGHRNGGCIGSTPGEPHRSEGERECGANNRHVQAGDR